MLEFHSRADPRRRVFGPYNLSAVLHPPVRLERQLDQQINNRAYLDQFLDVEISAARAYILKHRHLNETRPRSVTAYDHDGPVHLKSSSFSGGRRLFAIGRLILHVDPLRANARFLQESWVRQKHLFANKINVPPIEMTNPSFFPDME